MTVKCTALFQCTTSPNAGAPPQRTSGWSESWYFNGDVTAAMNAFATAKNSWCMLRARLLAPSCSINEQRYQIVTTPVGPSVVRYKQIGGNFDVTDIPQMSLLISCPGAGVVNQKHYEMRNIPDEVVKGGEYNPSADGWQSPFTDFIKGLALFQFRGLDLTQTNYDLSSIAGDGTVTTVQAHTLNPGDLVNLTRLKNSIGESIAGGKYKVQGPITPNTFKLVRWNGPVQGNPASGKVRKVVYSFFNVDATNTQPERIGTRKVGRPFDLYRGRR